MKRKFSKILGIGLTLALLASMLVMAAPVSATHTSTATIAFQEGASNVVGDASILDLKVTNDSGSNDSIYEVKIDFSSSDFTVTGAGTVPTGWTASGPTSQVVTYTAAAGSEIAPGALLGVTFSPAVTNQATAGSKTAPVFTTKDAGSRHILVASSTTGWVGYIAKNVDVTSKITYLKESGAFPISVSVIGDDITVTLAIDAEDNPVSTASEVAAKINADAAASLLVDAAAATGHTDYVVQVMGEQSLTGGTGAGAPGDTSPTPTELNVIAAPFTVWVDVDGSDGNSGTEASPVATIVQGVLIAQAGGTVNVLPGTYTLSARIDITLDGLTLQSTGGAAVTIIDVQGVADTPRIRIDADDVTFEGFTLKATTGDVLRIGPIGGSGLNSGVTIRNNIFTGSPTHTTIAIATPDADVNDLTIANNVIQEYGIGIWIGAGNYDLRIVDNTITGSTSAIDGAIVFSGGASGVNSSITVSGNTITDNAGLGIVFGAAANSEYSDIVIEGNIISGNAQDGIAILSATIALTSLEILGNDIIGNTGNGIYIEDISGGSNWGSTNVINNNNIYDNVLLDIDNDNANALVDAENNWWGRVGGPLAGQIAGAIDYSPWLNALYGIAPVTTIELAQGWNLISLPLYIPPANRAPATLLAGVTGVDIVWGNYDPALGDFWSYVPGSGGTLTAMSDGKGYWVKMTAADTLDISALGTELPEAPTAPPTYDVVEGWNLIGFKSTTAKTASTYLSAIDGDYTMIYGFANGVYFAVQSDDNLEPGYGYWIAVTEPGTIYP